MVFEMKKFREMSHLVLNSYLEARKPFACIRNLRCCESRGVPLRPPMESALYLRKRKHQSTNGGFRDTGKNSWRTKWKQSSKVSQHSKSWIPVGIQPSKWKLRLPMARGDAPPFRLGHPRAYMK